jgi:dipeptidyl aminopeptidase/acylaminoacyl peptidase
MRRLRPLGLAALVLCAPILPSCSTSSTSPRPSLPTFVYVSDVSGPSQLFLFRNDSSIRVTNDVGNDTDPRSAAGLLVFTSDRDRNQEVYIADTLGAVQHRVTNSAANDFEPDLSPHGDQIAFASNRTGLPRIWIVPAPALADTGFPTATQLATGSDVTVPEQSPAWSPDGSQIAFTSTRTGTSQVFVVAATGGVAVQLSHEAGGAFSPDWSADGKSVVYQSNTGTPTIVKANANSDVVTPLASDSLGIGEPTCNATFCLGVTNPNDTSGAIVSFLLSSPATTSVVLTRANNERQPAIIVAP